MPRTAYYKNEKKKEKVVEPIKEIEEIKEPEVIIKKEVIPVKKTFEQNDGIMCRSVCSGVLFIQGPKTGTIYQFTDYDDETEIEYRDLVAMVRSKDKNVYEPRIIIEDKDFLNEYSAVEDYYSSQFKTRDIKAILDMNEDEMVEAVKKLPRGALDNLKSIAAFQVANGYLDSRRKIKTLNEVLGIDLDLVGELMSDN